MKKLHQRMRFRRCLCVFFLTLASISSLFASSYGTIFSETRTDFRDESIYFVMTTRFYDGDVSNNTQCWDGQSYNTGDPAWRGDFKGLIEKLDYIKAMGFTAVWVTPIVENASGYDYHGYHASNFSKVDHRYESEDVAFEDLVAAVHSKGMKIILDIVINHTGNFGESNLCPLFKRDWDADQSNLDDCMIPLDASEGGLLPSNYYDLESGKQYAARLSKMKNTSDENGQKSNYDSHNYWHHYAQFNWDETNRWWGQIAGDCVDLNTENPAVYNYLIQCYTTFIAMGVDGFRIDTGGHIPRLTFNKAFIPAFMAAAEQYKDKRGGFPFYMYAEVCARYSSIWYREHPNLSPLYYTWKESQNYDWDVNPESWNSIVALEGDKCDTHTNHKSVQATAIADLDNKGAQPISNNAFLNGNDYHTPDYSKASGLNVIDFTVHHSFVDIGTAWNVANRDNDQYYNDATWNVVYVDSHDYAPNGAPEDKRYSKGTTAWAENLCLMYTFRGIPCVYYGSEIEFKAGAIIDKGPNIPLKESGRAYYGGYIKGSINVNDFADYSNASGNIAQTLNHPLAKHIQRLSQIRMAVPALRKGQYSKDNCSGSYAFKRRYVDSNTDSYALVCISGGATFNNIPNGTYIDAVTGDTKVVSNNSLTASCSGSGNLRVYVLNTNKTNAPGKIGVDGQFIYGSSPVNIPMPTWDGSQEELVEEPEKPVDPEDPGQEVVEPTRHEGEQIVFFKKPSSWGSQVNAYVYYKNGSTVEVNGAWPGKNMTSLGNGVYSYLFTEGTIGSPSEWYIIFNSSGKQTAGDPGFICKNGAYYTFDGEDHIVPITTVGINNVSENSPRVYVSNMNIHIENADDQNIMIATIDGRILYSGKQTIIPVSSNGIYIVKIGEVTTKVFVK